MAHTTLTDLWRAVIERALRDLHEVHEVTAGASAYEIQRARRLFGQARSYLESDGAIIDFEAAELSYRQAWPHIQAILRNGERHLKTLPWPQPMAPDKLTRQARKEAKWLAWAQPR